MKSLLPDKRLTIFGACVVAFFAASAAMAWPGFATPIVAGTILLPQAIVAAISPLIGRHADQSGRRPLLGWV